jgi:hypothetical protein
MPNSAGCALARPLGLTPKLRPYPTPFQIRKRPDPDEFMTRQQVNGENGSNPTLDREANPLNINELAFHEAAGKRQRKKMLKMQDDPDELLKTKGEKLGGIDDPDDLEKTKELGISRGISG